MTRNYLSWLFSAWLIREEVEGMAEIVERLLSVSLVRTV